VSSAAAPAATAETVPAQAELPEPQRRILVNLTNKRLELTSPDGMTLVLPPLGRRLLKEATLARFDLDGIQGRSLVAIEDPPAETGREAALLGVAFWAAVAVVVYGLGSGRGWGYWVGCAVGFTVLGFGAWRAASSGTWTRWLAQSLGLLFVVGVGVLLPGAAIWFSGGVDAVWSSVRAPGEATAGDVDTLVWRALQVVFIATASLVPGLLYFLFDRARLGTLRDRFARQIFRFDGSVTTCSDIDAKYGTLLEEAYGPADRATGRLQPGTLWPVLVSTVVIAFGWVLTMVSTGDVTSLDALFYPSYTPVAFAFLGAYFFALHAILRGYVRGDLRPKTYSYITVRVLSVIVLAWILEALLEDGKEVLALAFLTGIVPDTALYRIREFVRAAGGSRRGMNSLFEPLPLTNLDGIDLYDRARLETEGVTNIEALAHHDLVDLMIQTRIPVARLVDWTDQAILYLHLGVDAAGRDTKGRSALETLRRHGIRTATDLERAHAAAARRGGDAEAEFLDLLVPEGDGEPPRLRVILDTMKDDEWMDALRYWRDPTHVDEQTIRYPQDFAAA